MKFLLNRSFADGHTVAENTESLLTSEVKQHRARLVLGWGTAWEDLRVLSAFLAIPMIQECLATSHTGGWLRWAYCHHPCCMLDDCAKSACRAACAAIWEGITRDGTRVPLTKQETSGHPESNQGPSDRCMNLQSDALPTEL